MTIIPMRRDAESPLSQSIKREARAFTIWRFARARNWQVTALQIHEETGIRLATVREICAERQWPILHDAHARRRSYEVASIYKTALDGVRPVDREFR